MKGNKMHKDKEKKAKGTGVVGKKEMRGRTGRQTGEDGSVAGDITQTLS